MIKPRTRFCWECGRQLYGNHFEEMIIDGHPRIMHKSCAKLHEDPAKLERHREMIKEGR